MLSKVLRFRDRRGVSIVFNWIFSLVAGVVILSFLVYFAVQHTDLFGKVTARVVAEELDVLFSGYETIKTRSDLDFDREVKLEFKCENETQEFRINGKGEKKVWGKIIFAPKEIKSSHINIFTESWNVPFRVANFIYIWDRGYDLQGAPSEIKEIEGLNDVNGKKVRMERNPSLIDSTIPCPSIVNVDGKVIYYDETDLGDYIGKICFKEGSEVFFGKAMLLGAIFSEDYEDYKCLSEVAKKRFNIMEKVYNEKMRTLIANGQCEGMTYSRFKSPLSSFSAHYNKDFDSLKSAVRNMKRANEDIIKGGCAGVY